MSMPEPRGCLATAGILIMLVSLFSLVRAALALGHHAPFVWSWARGAYQPMYPSQAVLGFGLAFIIGFIVFSTALTQKRKWHAKPAIPTRRT